MGMKHSGSVVVGTPVGTHLEIMTHSLRILPLITNSSERRGRVHRAFPALMTIADRSKSCACLGEVGHLGSDFE